MSTYAEDHWSRVGPAPLPIREIERMQRERDIEVARSALRMVADWFEALGHRERGESADAHYDRIRARLREFERRAGEGYPEGER